MYLSAIIGLISSGAMRSDAERHAAGYPLRRTPAVLTELNDHYLRDIGFARERTARQHRYIIWM
jgi:hypothetical protein